jgi:hypothetical protein
MEAIYSSTPETRNPLKAVLLVTISAILFGAAWWWCDHLNKKRNESSNIR